MATSTKHPLCTDEGTHYPHTFPFEIMVTCDGADLRGKTLDIPTTSLPAVQRALNAVGATLVSSVYTETLSGYTTITVRP